MRNHLLPGRSRAFALLALALLSALLSAALLAGPAMATPGEQVCAPLSSGKIDVVGNQPTVTITAPAGQIISAYCVKAGSANQGDGPVYVTLAQPVASITFGHPTGKDISHYSYTLVPVPPTPTSVQTAPTLTDLCGPDYALAVPPDAAGHTFATDASGAPGGIGTVVVTATLRAGFIWSDGSTAPKTWSFSVTSTPCVQTASEPPAPTLQDVCGPDFVPALPADTASYAYSIDASGVVDGVGTVVIRATLAAGFVWSDGSTAPREWSFVVTASPCVAPVVDPVPPTVTDECGAAYELAAPADGDGYVVSVDESGVVDGEGVVVVTATLDPGRTWSDGGTEPRAWRLTVSGDDCDVVDGIASPTFLEVCGPDGETPYVLPADGEHHRYVVEDPGAYVDGERVVVVTVAFDEGWAAPEGTTIVWSRTLYDAPCDTPAATADIVVTPATCTAPGTATPGAIEHATWDPIVLPALDGGAPSDGRLDAPAALADAELIPAHSASIDDAGAPAPVEVVLVARAVAGATFDLDLPGVSSDGTTRTFVVLVPAADPRLCPLQPPVSEPPVSEPPTTTPPVVRFVAAAPRAQAPQPTIAALPRTGTDVTSLLVLGALLALTGAGLAGRRHRGA